MWRSLLQFAVLGAALFAVDRLWWGGEPAPAVVIPAARVAALQDELAQALGHPPTSDELARAIAPEVDDEVLYREALRRGYQRDDPVVFRRLVQNLRFAGAPDDRGDEDLFADALALRMHESDVVVRRRLVQRMRFDLEGASLPDPSDAELRAYYERDAANYRSPARARFTQLYFRAEHEAQALRALVRLRGDRSPPETARVGGDAFLYPADQPPQTRDELAERFGASFADGVFAAEPGAWSGPFRSAYGVHLVWVRERLPERALALDEVRDSVRYAVIAERRHDALERALSELRDGVRVVVESPAP